MGIKNFGSGKLASGTPDFSLTFVDVRDVARGHMAAGFLPADRVANQRYILNGSNVGMPRQMASRAVGRKNEMDNSKSLRDLELNEYRSLQETLCDMFAQCIEKDYFSSE